MGHRFAVAAFVLPAVLVACRGDARPDPPTSAATTGRFELTVLADGPSGSVSLRASGSFDDGRHRYSMVTDLSAFVPGLDGHLAIVEMPDAVFVDCPYLARLLHAPTAWISVRGAGGDMFRSSMLDPRQHRDWLMSDSGATASVAYFDVGAPVVIEPPADGEVTDETDALDRLLGGTTGG